MADYDIFPDAEAIVGYVIRVGVPCRTYSSIPQAAEYPLVIVKRLGGLPAQRVRLDTAELQLDVYGTTKSEARLLALQARREVWQAQGTTVTVNASISGFITGVEDSQGLTWLPDPTNVPKDRYVLGLRVFLHV